MSDSLHSASNNQPVRRSWTRRAAVRALRLVVIVGLVLVVLRMSGCMESLFYHPESGPTPVPPGYIGAQSVWFPSSDGTQLHGWFIPARDKSGAVITGQRTPGILHVHGNAGNIESHAWFTEYLPPAGFAVFVFDYRGYGESHGRPRKRGPLIADTNAALDALLARPEVDPQRIAMYGQSLGGAIGLNVMADRPEIKCGVFESPFASWRSIAACAIGGDNPNLLCRTLAAILIPDSHSPTDAIARINRPMLLLHGTADSIIPISQSRRLKDAAGDNATLIELPGGDHNTLRDSNPEIDKMVIDFFQQQFSSG